MKRFTGLIGAGMLAGFAILSVSPKAVANERPVEVEIAIPTTTGQTATVSTAFAAAVSRDVFTSLRPVAFEYTVAGVITQNMTLAFKREAGGVTYRTLTVASNAMSGVTFETNAWWYLKPDAIVVERSGGTNAASVKLIGLER